MDDDPEAAVVSDGLEIIMRTDVKMNTEIVNDVPEATVVGDGL